jgi:GrpB-like predicted nucleotidyltransferase (UPF0157 family)
MKRSLSEMSLEELWRLFPIILSAPNPDWQNFYIAEKNRILEIMPDEIINTHHIGSTSVPGMIAKPTIDILIEIRDDTNIDSLIDALTGIGYICSPQPNNPPPHLMFMKGYTTEGFADKVFHLHTRYKGEHKELIFRDILIKHPQVAREYEHLKIQLKAKFEFNRDAYTDGKSAFINSTLRMYQK